MRTKHIVFDEVENEITSRLLTIFFSILDSYNSSDIENDGDTLMKLILLQNAIPSKILIKLNKKKAHKKKLNRKPRNDALRFYWCELHSWEKKNWLPNYLSLFR